MGKALRYRNLYLVLLIALGVLLFVSAGNGLQGRPLDYSDWPYRMLRPVCHQLAERSFSVGGVPMAVNTRCFGIFTGLFAVWLVVPWVGWQLQNKRWPVLFLLLMLSLHAIDYIAGQLSVWNSSNFSRFFSGLLLGGAFVIAMADLFFRPIKEE